MEALLASRPDAQCIGPPAPSPVRPHMAPLRQASTAADTQRPTPLCTQHPLSSLAWTPLSCPGEQTEHKVKGHPNCLHGAFAQTEMWGLLRAQRGLCFSYPGPSTLACKLSVQTRPPEAKQRQGDYGASLRAPRWNLLEDGTNP